MGCSSSVPVLKKDKENLKSNGVNNPVENNSVLKKNIGTSKAYDITMEKKAERSDPDGATSNEQSQDPSLQEEEELSQQENEDKFDLKIRPLTHPKKHATQETLNFVYQTSLASTPMNTSAFSSPAPRYRGEKRRPSGVPPPTREFRPGDFIYQKNLNSHHHPSMAEEQDEEV